MDLSDAMILYKDISQIQDCYEEIRKFAKFKYDKHLPCEFNLVINNTVFDLEYCLEFQMKIVLGDKILATINTSVCDVKECILQEVKGKCDVGHETEDPLTHLNHTNSSICCTEIKNSLGNKDSRLLPSALLSAGCTVIVFGFGNFVICFILRKKSGLQRFRPYLSVKSDTVAHGRQYASGETGDSYTYIDNVSTSQPIYMNTPQLDSIEEERQGYLDVIVTNSDGNDTHSGKSQRMNVEDSSTEYQDIIIITDSDSNNLNCAKSDNGSEEQTSP